MSLVLLLLAVAVVGVVVAVAAGRSPAGMPAPVGSSPHRPLPLRELVPEDLDDVRFSVALRGYRADEVDAVLDRLRTELAERDLRLAELGAALATGQPLPPPQGAARPAAAPTRPEEH